MGSNPSGTRAFAPSWPDDGWALLMHSPDTADEFLIFRWDQVPEHPGYPTTVWWLAMFPYLFDRLYAVQNFIPPRWGPVPKDEPAA